MIVYKNSSVGFLEDVETNRISDRIKEAFAAVAGKKNFAEKETDSWINSMQFMGNVVRRAKIAEDCGILIEYGLPSSSKRIDFIISGKDESGKRNFIIIELKQWKEAQSTLRKDLVLTSYYSGRHSTHPSYQASSYKWFLSDYNENVYKNSIQPYSCAYLHNYPEKNPEPLKDPVYSEIVNESPVYFKDDQAKLEEFIRKHVGYGNGSDILYDIESGNIKPGKKLIDHVTGLFKGNMEFHLLEEQKVAYETAIDIALNATGKTVYIIRGGPGTGKSVISMSLLGGLLKKKKNTLFVAPNASFRDVMLHRLTHGRDTERAKHLISGSGKFVGSRADIFDTLIVDEAHRLKNEKAYMYQGENQIRDIINAARVSIFFVDEDQIIRPEDIGSVSEIKKIAGQFGAQVLETELSAQFRCAGADGFVNWISDVLQIRQTANFNGWDNKDFEFRIFDDPNLLRDYVFEKDKEGHSARLLAGYAWPWTSARNGNPNSQIHDVCLKEFDFSMPWNSRQAGTTWAINDEGLHQVGCVHTSQGLEFDYTGVIVGKDLMYDPAGDSFVTDWDHYKDSNGKKGMRNKPEELNRLVRQVYRILLTRGMKGCGVFFQDKNMAEYFRRRLG